MSLKAKSIGIGIGLAVLIGGACLWAKRPSHRDLEIGPNFYVGNETCALSFRRRDPAFTKRAREYVCDDRRFRGREALDGMVFHDEERDVDFYYRLTKNGLFVTVPKKHGDKDFPLQIALGSGEHAVTFVTLLPTRDGGTTGLEHRVSIFGRDGKLGLTPSHPGYVATQAVEEFGRIKQPVAACIDCHTTTFSIFGDTLTDLRANVGCERCHGPGGHHVRAVEQKRDDLAILLGRGKATAQEEIRMCGSCHRHPETLVDMKIDVNDRKLARWQPIGLLQSECFKKSGHTLRCTTCHDPHENASRQREQYEGRCLQCHATDRSRFPPCPKSPREGCIDCHMPRIEIRPDISFYDHWIRIRNDVPKPAGDLPHEPLSSEH